MPGAWVLSPAQVDGDGKRITYVSTLQDKKLGFPHPSLPGVVLYEKYRTADVVSVLEDLPPPNEVPDWTLSFVRTDDLTNLRKDPLITFVLERGHEDLEYFLGKTFAQNLFSPGEREALIQTAEAFEKVSASQFRQNAETSQQFWEVLSSIGQILQPGWTPYGTYVAP
jgi:hypothetical protein